MSEMFVLHGLREDIFCYELQSFGDVFPSFQEVKDKAEMMYQEIKSLCKQKEYEVEEDTFHVNIAECSIMVSIFSEGVRFELDVFKKVV